MRRLAVTIDQLIVLLIETTSATPYDVRSIDVDISDGYVSLEAGQFEEYTMLNWMSIVPKD